MSQISNPQSEKQAAIDRLINDLSSQNITLREEARKSLALIGEPAIKSLSEALAVKNRETRREIGRTLVDMLRPEAVPYLVAALENDDPDVRWLATEGLIALGRKGLDYLLKSLIANPSSLWLRLGAHHVIFDLYIGEVHDSERRYLPLYGLSEDAREALRPVLIALESMDHAVLLPSVSQKALDIISKTP